MNYKWNFDFYVVICFKKSFGDGCVLYDVIKNVDQNCFYIGIGDEDLEGFCNLIYVGIVVNIEKVCWFVVMEFNDVYCVYGEFCIIDQVVDVFIKVDKIEVGVFSVNFCFIFFCKIMVFGDVWMVIQCVIVKSYFCVECEYFV